jgi:type I restriction enzyme M protein
MRQPRAVREVVSHPYETVTAFHTDPTIEKDAGIGFDWILSVLERQYGLIGAKERLVVESDLESAGYMVGSLRTRGGDPFLFLGSALPGSLADCELEIRKRLLSQHSATSAVVSDGEDHVFLRRRHDAERCEYALDVERDFGEPQELHLFGSTDASAERGTSGEKLEALFFEAHSAIRDIDGMHADEALDEVCKLIFTSLARTARDTEAVSHAAFGTGPEMIFPQEKAALLRCRYRDAVAALMDPDIGDAFSSPLRLSDAALLRVWRVLSTQNLAGMSADLKGRAFQRLLDPAIRAGMGQFFTPAPVVDFMVAALRPRIGERILDPFCGSGHFLSTAVSLASHHRRGEDPSITIWASEGVHGIEKSERMLRIARTDMMLQETKDVSLHRGDALAPFGNFATLKPNSFDVVLTNPPFGSLLGPDATRALGSFELTSTKASTPLEVLGLERAVQFARPGGRIGIVLPEGVLTNQRLSHVRAWLLARVIPVAIVSLPVETFSPFGANVRTCVFFALKNGPVPMSAEHLVVVGGSDCIGYDASGRPTAAPSDLPSLAVVIEQAFSRAAGVPHVA